MRRRLTIALGLAAALLAGCANPADSGPRAGGGPSQPPTTTQPRSSPPTGPTLVLDGVAERGVEPGCVVLRAGGTQYVLLGAGGKTLGGVPMRVPIRVRAVVLTGVLSYCQQGTPVQVLQLSRR